MCPLLCVVPVVGDAVNIDWLGPDGEKIQDDHKNVRVHTHDGTSSTLVIHAARTEDAGAYTCVAGNTGTTSQASANLEVLLFEAAISPGQEFTADPFNGVTDRAFTSSVLTRQYTPKRRVLRAAPSADGCTTQDYMHTDRYHDCP
ncbi:hypothetical protein NFI96_000301 [Prochilodus magdalenae]|nr:hypothetical protein NFI96_000301 [Prochilodus magdalenae]